jgi:hypothetical protein
VAAGEARGDDLSELGGSILVRSVRALEARDAIGVQFYMPQNATDEDQIMYHFNYLTLLLAGALDAQAMVAKRAYQVSFKETQVSFRKCEFRKCLQQKGALTLYNLITGQRFKNITIMLYELRNTIHAAALTTIAYQQAGGTEHSFIAVPPDIGRTLWDAAEQLGSAHRWGLSKIGSKVHLEPYSYATALVEEGLSLIDAVAAATDIERLFPAGQPIPVFRAVAPTDGPFEWAERIALLA